MKPTTKKVVLITVVALPLLLVFADEYPALRFRGDGRFSSGPVFGYWIRLEAIPFGRAGEYTFHFRGMPNEEMSLQLYTDGESGRPALTNLSTRLEAVLSDQKAEWCARAPEWYLRRASLATTAKFQQIKRSRPGDKESGSSCPDPTSPPTIT